MKTRIFALCALAIAALALILGAACSGGDDPIALSSRDDLKSYRAELVQERLNTAGGVEARLLVTGEVILHDRERQTMVGSVSGVESRADSIAVGDRVWVRGDGGQWRTGERADSHLSLAQPSYERVDAVTSGLEGTGETVNGVDALRHELSPAQIRELFGFMLPALDERTTATIWSVPGAGFLVRYVIEGPDMRLEYEMTDINSDDIVIEPPDVVATGPVEPGGSNSGTGAGNRGPLFDIASTETSREDPGGSLEQPPADRIRRRPESGAGTGDVLLDVAGRSGAVRRRCRHHHRTRFAVGRRRGSGDCDRRSVGGRGVRRDRLGDPASRRAGRRRQRVAGVEPCRAAAWATLRFRSRRSSARSLRRSVVQGARRW